MADTAERRPGGSGVRDDALGGGIGIRITACPCGCRTRPPYVDDPDCVRYLPVPRPAEWGTYDVRTLGLAPHDRETCRHCRAVAV